MKILEHATRGQNQHVNKLTYHFGPLLQFCVEIPHSRILGPTTQLSNTRGCWLFSDSLSSVERTYCS